MASAMTWVLGGVLYFAMIAATVLALGWAGMSESYVEGVGTSSFVRPDQPFYLTGGNTTESAKLLNIKLTSPTDTVVTIGRSLALMWSFFGFDVTGLGDVIGSTALIFLRVFFVYIPLIFLGIATYYSLPGVAGGGS